MADTQSAHVCEHRRATGLIAQDVAAVMPEAVRTDEQTGRLSVAYGNLVGLLVEAIRDIQGMLEGQNANNLKAVYRKYALPKFNEVALLPISSL
jgi:hypothetical protein